MRTSTKTTLLVGAVLAAGCATTPLAQDAAPVGAAEPANRVHVLGGTPTPKPTHTPTPKPTSTPTPKPTPTPCPCDVTGGGFIFLNGERVNFGFNARTIAGNSRIHGHVNIVDRDNDVHYLSEAVTAIDCDVMGEHPRLTGTVTIEGTLKTGEAFTFIVEDTGEPGSIDAVTFFVDGVLIFEGDLGGMGTMTPGGGNIQIHSDECT